MPAVYRGSLFIFSLSLSPSFHLQSLSASFLLLLLSFKFAAALQRANCLLALWLVLSTTAMYLTAVTCVLYLAASVIAAPTSAPECSFSNRVYNLAVTGTCHLAPRLRTRVGIPDTPTGAVETVTVEVCTGKSFTGHCQHLNGVRDSCCESVAPPPS